MGEIFSPSLSLSLSRPHLANDEAHALYHGYACSESTSASLRPKLQPSIQKPKRVFEVAQWCDEEAVPQKYIFRAFVSCQELKLGLGTRN